MENEKTMRKWSELKGLKLVVPSLGKTIGVVEDFYFQTGTNAIYAFSIRTRLAGILSLPVRAIKEITTDAVIVENEQTLMKRIPPFPLGTTLLAKKVLAEDGRVAGTISDILIGVLPVQSLRVAGFDLAEDSGRRANHHKLLNADGVINYDEDTLIIQNQVARQL